MNFVQVLEKLKKELGVSGGKPFSISQRETIYAAAFGMYERGEYSQSADFFTMLILHDPYEVRFWKGLASSRQMEKKFKEALHAWAIHALLSGQDPMTHFHAAECYLSMGEKEEAKKALALAEKGFSLKDPTKEKIGYLQEKIYG